MQFDFLICSERSGSNLLTRILNAHPSICGPFPSHLFRIFTQNYHRYGDLQKDENWRCFVDDVAFYMQHIFATWKSHLSASELLDCVKHRSLAAVGRACYEREAAAHGKSRLFVKENHTWSFAPYLLSHFSSARFIWLVRDPRDMAMTWRDLTTGGVVRATDVWLRDQRGSLRLYGYLNDIGRILRIRFEDLLQHPESTLKRCCEFLEVVYSPGLLSFHETDVTQENASRMVSWGDLGKPLISDNFGQFRRGLSETETRYIEGMCHREMKYFGYELAYRDVMDPNVIRNDLPDEAKYNRMFTPDERAAYDSWQQALDRVRSRDLDGVPGCDI